MRVSESIRPLSRRILEPYLEHLRVQLQFPFLFVEALVAYKMASFRWEMLELTVYYGSNDKVFFHNDVTLRHLIAINVVQVHFKWDFGGCFNYRIE